MAVGVYFIIRSRVMNNVLDFYVSFSDYLNGAWVKDNNTSSYYESDGSSKTGRIAIKLKNSSQELIPNLDGVVYIPLCTHTTKASSLTATTALQSCYANAFNYNSYVDPYNPNQYLVKATMKNSLALRYTSSITLYSGSTVSDVWVSDSFSIDTNENSKIINLQGCYIYPGLGSISNINGVKANNLFCLAGQKLDGLTLQYSETTFPDTQLTEEQYYSWSYSSYSAEYRPIVDSTHREIYFTDCIASQFTSGDSGYTYNFFTPATEDAIPVDPDTVQLAILDANYSSYATWYYKAHSSNNWSSLPTNQITSWDTGYIDTDIDIAFTPNSGRTFYNYNNKIYLAYCETNDVITSANYNDLSTLYSSSIQTDGIYNYGVFEFTYDSNENKYITTIDISDKTNNCKIIAIQDFPIRFSLTNSTSNNVFDTGIKTQLINEIIATANTGYIFTSAPTFDNEVYIYSATLSNNNLTATFTNILLPTAVYSTPEFIFSPDVKPTPVITTYPFVLVFSPTNNQLNEIAGLRFSYISSSTSEVIDLGNYIIDLYKTYMPLQLTELEYIVKMYTINTGIPAYMIEEQTSVANCGNIELNEYYNNVIDYSDTELTIYLPFHGIEKLDTDKYMGKSINLKYIADILTGDCNIILSTYNDDTEDYITTDIFNCNVSYKVPYKINSNFREGAIGEFKTNALTLMDKTPYIKIEKPITISNGLINSNTRNALTNFKNTGYCEFSDLIFPAINNNLTNEEQEQIIELLERGVII